MVTSIYSNRKGIYKDLYREIDSDNRKKDDTQAQKPKKGIYVQLYKQIGFKNNEKKKDSGNLYLLAFEKLVSDIFSKVSYTFSAATGQVKMLIVACVVAKKPINSYIENRVQNDNYTSTRHAELISASYQLSSLDRS